MDWSAQQSTTQPTTEPVIPTGRDTARKTVNQTPEAVGRSELNPDDQSSAREYVRTDAIMLRQMLSPRPQLTLTEGHHVVQPVSSHAMKDAEMLRRQNSVHPPAP